MENEVEDEPQTPNPFASPEVTAASAIPDFDPNTEMREFHFGMSLAKWLLVCMVSAAPSFYIGSTMAQQYGLQSAAMLLGILTFVAFYVFLESRKWTRRKLMSRPLRIAVWVGYVTRVAISVLFPVAMFLDIFCGLLSVSLTSGIFGMDFGPGRGSSATESMSLLFAWFYITTLVQGVILNCVLGAYVLIVFAFALLFRKRP